MDRQALAPRLSRVAFDQIEGWRADDLDLALAAFRLSAREILEDGSAFRRASLLGGERSDWEDVCRRALEAEDARAFFQSAFVPFRVEDKERPQGLFTGYFEPEVEGTRRAAPEYPVPVYRKPTDLVAFTAEEEAATGLRYGRRAKGRPEPYAVRREIEQGALAGRGLEICWLKSWVDAFFMHIQGNGRVRLEDGGVIRLSYAAKTGHPYTGVGGVLADRGVMTRETMSMQSVKRWMAANPDAARELMWLNKSYVFFRETAIDDQNLGAIGAAKVHLTPKRSLAVDRSLWTFGTPMWIETQYPPEAGPGRDPVARLMIAQDTGSAIKGAVRGDFYWGWGEDAALVAGHMKSLGRMTVLLPTSLARKVA
jgi:membrane-bound lytic murein transglycosylase A